MVSLRLIGYPEDVDKMVALLKLNGLNVANVSRPYPCKSSKQVRVYVDINVN